MQKSRVVITGIGIISSIGNNINEVASSLYNGESGVAIDEERTKMGFLSPLTGTIKNFSCQTILPKKQRKTMTDFSLWAYEATMQAILQSELSEKEIQSDSTGIVFGCDSSSLASIEQSQILKKFKDTRNIGSGYIFKTMTSNVTMNLNTILKNKGASWSVSSACSSGANAIGQAFNLIQEKKQTRVICGGAQEINWQSMCSFDGLNAFSKNIHNPQKASRPFDNKRDGLVPSGGAAALVLEDYELAKKKGKKILGEIISYAFSSDGSHIALPNKEGLKLSMQKSIKASNLKPKEFDLICAHATSTTIGDSVEAVAISEIFGDKNIFVSSFKSMTGHEFWMAGASNVVYATIMANKGFYAPSINFETPDESSKKIKIVKKKIEKIPKNVLFNAAGFGGTNASLVVNFSHCKEKYAKKKV